MPETERYTFRGSYIPERMMPGIERYVKYGIIPGSFLQAIICNELKEAFICADDENFVNIAAYVNYFYNNVPRAAWGSRGIMEAWSEGIKKRRAEELSKQWLKRNHETN